MAFLIGIGLLIIFLGIWRSLSLEAVVLNLIVPLLPVYSWGIPQVWNNREAAQNMDSLKTMVDSIWQDAYGRCASEKELIHAARELQDEIFQHRRSAPLVFDKLYSLFRTKDDTLMYKGSEGLVQEALELMKKNCSENK